MKTSPRSFRRRSLTLLAVSALSLVFICEASAALLVYEGFDYTATDPISEITPDASRGFTGSNSYNSSGNAPSNMSVTSGGLAFSSSLPGSGNALSFNGGTNVASAQLSLSVPNGSDIYVSYLINFSARGGSNGNGFEVRIGSGESSSNPSYRTYADTRTGSSSTRVAVDYTTSPDGNTALGLNTTYWILSRFTNVGVTADGGTADVWAFTAAQFNDFYNASDKAAYLAANQGNTAVISAYATDTSQQFTGTTIADINTGYLQFVNVGNVGTLDEVRIATTLAEAVPEPSRALLLCLGLVPLLWHRRKQL